MPSFSVIDIETKESIDSTKTMEELDFKNNTKLQLIDWRTVQIFVEPYQETLDLGTIFFKKKLSSNLKNYCYFLEVE